MMEKIKKYDCIVGVSGGVDSSYTLVQAKKLGLRPLAVHMDNGWDSELASNNIKNIIEKLQVDLFTHVIDWNEYRDLMQSFFNADVIDIELLYDNAMLAVDYKQAEKYGIKYILAGTNTSTEGMIIPEKWRWFKYDKRNILKIANTMKVKIKTFPSFGTIDFIKYQLIKKIYWISFLDYLPTYNKFDALKILQNDYGYKPYPYKHYESVFTRFYQGFLLPEKFNVDKRKVHLSTLIISGQIKKEDAIKQMQGKYAYPTEKDLNEDIEYFLKKMKWNKNDLNEYLKRKEVPHDFYGSEKKFFFNLVKIKKIIKSL